MKVALTTGDDDCPLADVGSAASVRTSPKCWNMGLALGHYPWINGGQGLVIVNRILRPGFACSGCEAFAQGSTIACEAIQRIAQLYAVERRGSWIATNSARPS